MMSLNYKVFGSGEPVFILHGLFGMLDNWQTFARELAQDYEVYIIDQRNHGRSPHSEEFDYRLLSQDLYEFMLEHNIDSAHIIGHSMGGKTVMQFASDHTDRVHSLSVVDIAPKAYQPSHLEIFAAIRSLDLNQIDNRKDADLMLSKSISSVGIRLFLLKNLSRTPDGWKWKANFDSLYHNYDTILGTIDIPSTITIPSLFVYSESSGYILESDIEQIEESFTQSSFESMNAGHWIHAEQPQQLLALIRNHLKKS